MYTAVTIIVLFVALYGYALAALATRSSEPRPGDALDSGLLFVLLVPALNEEQVISRTLSSLLRLRGNFIVLVIDDDSDDGTAEAVQPFLQNPRVRLLRQPPE